MSRSNSSLKKIKHAHVAKKRSQIWFKQAEYDIQAAGISFSQGFYEWSAYQSEQSVEKALKSVIVHAGYHPPRLHKLPILIGIANSLNPSFKQIKLQFKEVESFTFISRYPFLLPGRDDAPHDLVEKGDAQKALQQATVLLQQIAGVIAAEVKAAYPVVDISDKLFTTQEIEARLREVTAELINGFDVQKIILFGSFAREFEQNIQSTMDVLVIANTELGFVQRITKARELTKGGIPIIEPLVYTPEEFDHMFNEEGEGFIENAIEEGKIIYEKSPTSNTIQL